MAYTVKEAWMRESTERVSRGLLLAYILHSFSCATLRGCEAERIERAVGEPDSRMALRKGRGEGLRI
jgi:hypothetical protein